jgi:hypothetical protein
MALKMRLPETHNDTQARFARRAAEGGWLATEGVKPSALDVALVVIGVTLLVMFLGGIAYRVLN